MPHKDTNIAIKQVLNPSQMKGGTILNLFIKTGKDCSKQYEVPNATKVYFLSLDQNWVLNSVITSYALLYIT